VPVTPAARLCMFGHVVGAAELKTVPLFASLDEEELRELASWFDEQACSEGVCLTGEGAGGYSFYVLVDGNAEVTAEGQELATLGPGDFFGEIAILGGGRRSATVTTTSPAKLLVMFGTEFRQLQQAQPDIAARIEDTMQQRLEVSV
jgi:CRP/FNR family transcriptional regulator, cyclic AMP receptor protein